jgi:hypothetical protein
MTSDPPSFSWSRLYERRRDIQRRFGRHFALPLRSRAERVVADHLSAGQRVLDVGAHRRQFKDKVERCRPGLVYRSLDTDRANDHDYYGFEEVEERFDGAYLFEVLEHLSLDGIAGILAGVRGVLAPEGLLFVTTPCVFHPVQFRRDATHRTPLAHDELGGVLEAAGFDVLHLYRLFHAPWSRWAAHVVLAGWLHRFLSVDYATSVMAVARRTEGGG